MRERKEFAQRLSQLRCDKDISARDMSMSIGKSHGYINSIENGKILPSMENFFNICDFLEITPRDFFDEADSAPGARSLLIEHISRLDDDQNAHILAIVDALLHR